jgi:uncharacterized Zn-binding protein involved in type VI secretion
MPTICKRGSLGTTGHGCTTVVPVKTTQSSVFVNGIPVARRGDPTRPHKIKVGRLCVGHSARINRGSSSVFVQNIPIARVGDSVDRGRMITGAPTVLAGG